jgi:hypothetical protein
VTWQDGVMADRYRTPGGWTVEVVQLAAGERLRIRHHGYYVADVGNADDLARWIPADELVQLERDALMASMSLEEMLAIGSVITAMPIVNAIPAVIAARPRHRHLRRPPDPGIPPRSSRFMSSGRS